MYSDWYSICLLNFHFESGVRNVLKQYFKNIYIYFVVVFGVFCCCCCCCFCCCFLWGGGLFCCACVIACVFLDKMIYLNWYSICLLHFHLESGVWFFFWFFFLNSQSNILKLIFQFFLILLLLLTFHLESGVANVLKQHIRSQSFSFFFSQSNILKFIFHLFESEMFENSFEHLWYRFESK